MLLVGGAKTNVSDKLQRNPLHYAAMNNNEALMELLLSKRHKEVAKIGSIAGAFNLRLLRRSSSPELVTTGDPQKERMNTL